MTTNTPEVRPVESAVTTIADPMRVMSDLSCEYERIIAAFEMVAASFHELTEQRHIKPGDVYSPWMVLLVVIESLRAADARFGNVESALLQRKEG